MKFIDGDEMVEDLLFVKVLQQVPSPELI